MQGSPAHTAAQRTAVQRSVVPPEGLTFRVFLVFFGIVSWNRGSLKAPDQPECAFGLWQYLVRASAASTHRPSTLSPSSPSTRPRQSTSENTNKKSHRKHTHNTHTHETHIETNKSNSKFARTNPKILHYMEVCSWLWMSFSEAP